MFLREIHAMLTQFYLWGVKHMFLNGLPLNSEQFLFFLN